MGGFALKEAKRIAHDRVVQSGLSHTSDGLAAKPPLPAHTKKFPGYEPVARPAVLHDRARVVDNGDHLVIRPAGDARSYGVIKHAHGVGGPTADEMTLAEKLAAGLYAPPVTVVMPLADKIVRRSWVENAAMLYQLVRFTLSQPPDLHPHKLFGKGAASYREQFDALCRALTKPPVWYVFKFKIDTTTPDCGQNFFQPFVNRAFPKLAVDIPGTIPDMLEASYEVGPQIDEMVLRTSINGKVIASSFSQGSGIMAPYSLLRRHTDPRLAPSCLIAVAAPIILDHNMPPVVNRIPVFNILPRDDSLGQAMGYGADDVRRGSARHNFPIRVCEPRGAHGLCAPSARLYIAIVKRHIEKKRDRSLDSLTF